MKTTLLALRPLLLLRCFLVAWMLLSAFKAEALVIVDPTTQTNAFLEAGVSRVTESDGTLTYSLAGNVGQRGVVRFATPTMSKPPQPVRVFKASFDLSYTAAVGQPSWGTAFFFAPRGVGYFGDQAAGQGLVLVINNTMVTNSSQANIAKLYWQGTEIASKLLTPLAHYSVEMSYYRQFGLTLQIDQEAPMVLLKPLDGWDSIVRSDWQFGFGTSALTTWTSTGISDISIDGVTPPFVVSSPNGPNLPDQRTDEGKGGSFTLTLDSLEGYVQSVRVTASSSNPSVFTASDLTITAPTPSNRVVTLRPLRKGSGDTIVTLTLDPGGNGPTNMVSYRHSVRPNDPPFVSAVNRAADQWAGFTQVVPLTVMSRTWSAQELSLEVTSFPTNMIDPRSIFLTDRDANQQQSLVFTPRAGVAGQGSPITVTVTDPLGASNNLGLSTLVKPPVPPPTVLGAGSALSLNTGSSVLQYAGAMGASPGSGLGSVGTIEAWVLPRALPDTYLNFIVHIGNTANLQGFTLALQSNGIPSVANWVNDFYPTNTAAALGLNRWYHLAGVINGQSVALYVDGTLVASGTLPNMPQISPGPTYIGVEPPGSPGRRHFVGHVDEVRIWNVARTADEIKASYNRVVRSDSPGLIRYFRCEEGFVPFVADTDGVGPAVPDGTVALVDSSMSQAHLPLVGFPTFVPGVPLVTRVDVPQNVPITFGAASVVTSNVLGGTLGFSRDVFFGPNSDTVAGGLVASPGWPATPDVVVPIGTALEFPPGGASGFGQRVAGYLVPPETGTYTLSIASLNEAQLYVSPSGSPSDMTLLVSSPASGVSFRQFDAFPSQQTKTLTLTAGQPCYIEVRHQSKSGASARPHLSVQWTLPSGALESPIPAWRMRPWGPANATPITVKSLVPPAWGQSSVVNGSVLYQPISNYFGTDTFAFYAQRGNFSSLPAVVEVNVVNRQPQPVVGSAHALLLDGQPGGVRSEASFDLTGRSFTVEAWARRSGEATNLQALFSFAPDPSGTPPHATFGWFAGATVGLQMAKTLPDADVRSTTAYTDTDWHHYAAVFDAASGLQSIYRDGILLGTNVATGVSLGSGRVFLGSVGGTSGFFQGAIDEFRLWNRARSLDEIRETLDVPLVGNEAGLQVYYRFDEGNGLTAYDTSAAKPGGIAYDATLLNPVTWVTSAATNLSTLVVPGNGPGRKFFLPAMAFGRPEVTYQIKTLPKNGTLTADLTTPGRYTYVPNRLYSGADSITYTVSANGLVSDEGVLTIQVTDVPIPPVLGDIRDQVIEEEDPAPTIEFLAFDEERPDGSRLTFTATSSNPTLLPAERVTFAGTGTNRWVTLNPVEGEVGTTTILIEASNTERLASTSFTLQVNPRLVFAVVDVGDTTGQPSSTATAINAAGQIVGSRSTVTIPAVSSGFFYSGYGRGSVTLPISNLGGSAGTALAVNASGQVVGSSDDAQGFPIAYVIRPGRESVPTRLGVLPGGSRSVATDVNDHGLIVGYAQVGDGTFRAVTATVDSPSLVPLALTNGFVSMWATAVNNSGEIIGYARRGSDGSTNAFLSVGGITQDLGRPSGAAGVTVQAINDQGMVVGTAAYASGASSRVVVYEDGAWTELGGLVQGRIAEVSGVNRFGQIVGRFRAASGDWHAFLYSDGRVYDLNDLMRGSNWTLSGASAINDRAQVAAQGVDDAGHSQALLLFPATEIGRRVYRPEGALPEQPDIDILVKTRSDDQPGNAFHWSAVDNKLYAIRPVVASVRWHTGTYETTTNLTEFGAGTFIRQVFTNEVLLNTYTFNVWPKDPEIHVAGAPVQLEPAVPGFRHSFVSMLYTTSGDAGVDSASKVFTNSLPGFSVLQYLRTDGRPTRPEFQTNDFTVVRTLLWNDPTAPTHHLAVTNVAWNIGTPVTNALHDDYPGLNGYVLNGKSYYDGAGPDAAHQRAARQGPILPVNVNTPANDFVVVWYAPDRMGVAWPSLPFQYALRWPADAPTLSIASGRGSGVLRPSDYPEMRIYHQPDDGLPGYNPNEEHALVVANTVYALRSDLNDAVSPRASDPYVLVKYREPASGEWRMRVFAVVTGLGAEGFRYDAEAGREIQAPLPISALPLMTAANVMLPGPGWRDHNGRFYALSARPTGGEDDVTVRYFYPLQPEFFYDLDRNGVADANEGDPIPWLDRLPGATRGQPVDVHYAILWPDGAPMLQVGQSLTTATAGLPDIMDMASASVIFDSLNPEGDKPLSAAVRLYDPLVPRTVALEEDFVFPATVTRRIEASTGNEVFPDLPYYLRIRLFHDPRNRLLGFRGFVLTPSPGAQPITLVNVMTARELETLLDLDPGGSPAFREAVERLYRNTRNPNQLDLTGDGVADDSLLVGIAKQVSTNTAGAVVTNLVRETLKGPKALAFGTPIAPATPLGLPAMQFAGPSQGMGTTNQYTNLVGNFTMELWVKPNDGVSRGGTPQATSGKAGLNGQMYAVHPGQGHDLSGQADYVGVGLSVGVNGASIFEHGDDRIYSPLVHDADLSGWHHYAIVYQDSTPALYIDGVKVADGLRGPSKPLPSTSLVQLKPNNPGYGQFAGAIAEFRIWDYARSAESIRANYLARMEGTETGLAGLWRFEEGAGGTVSDAAGGTNPGQLTGSPTWLPAALQVGPEQRYVVVAENDDPSLGGLPVGLHVISLTNSLARGSLAVIPSDNVLDERVTLRHSADFAGQPENFVFQWYYQLDAASDDPNVPAFDPTAVPAVDGTGAITDVRGWIPFAVEPESGQGVNDITLGTSRQSSLLILSDAWYLMRYGARDASGTIRWSGWIGDPSGTDGAPRAMFVPGWIKRVTSGINLFSQRSSEFENYAPNTLASALVSAGERYEGDVALNPDSLDQFGLIQIYSTVLRRARNLSIDGSPAVAFEPADRALLNAAGNLADLYALHGDEAFADAADPTIGLTTDSTSLGSLASSVFAFQNQASSLLDEELALLRGRDDRLEGVNAAPVYNRLFWNFTGRDGETAYVATYGVPDQNGDGFINAGDARILFPQGHGDAWGHYLTALTGYYDLLRHTNFIWHPRPEQTLVAGVPIEVNYQDERRFARLAASRARAGAQIVDRTYRLDYSEDPLALLVGGSDPNQVRAWGVVDWSRRVAQASYFDWVVGNSVLPATDTNVNHTGIQKVDRTTVPELMQIVTETDAAMKVLDRSDAGFNPLGFARGVVPFDLDPDQLHTGVIRNTHFEQIYQRALQALKNAENTFNRASALSAELRKQQNSVSDFSVAVAEQEASYLNDLIEIYGYPYRGDLGPGGAYPADYSGPDLAHWMYVDELDVTASNHRPPEVWDHVDTHLEGITGKWDIVLGASAEERLNPSAEELLIEVEYPVSTRDYAFEAPATWGKRRAEGRLQTQLRALMLAQSQLRQTLTQYENLVEDLTEKADVLDLRYGLKRDKNNLMVARAAEVGALGSAVAVLKIVKAIHETTSDTLKDAYAALEAAVPDMVGLAADVFAPVQASLYIAKTFTAAVPDKLAVAAEVAEIALEPVKEAIEMSAEIDLENKDSTFELAEQVKEFEGALRGEAVLRLDLFRANQALLQAARDLEATIAEGNRVLVARTVFRQITAGTIQADRYRDLGLRVFRNDALQKYDSQFQLAANYVYLAAAAYDYELNLGGTAGGQASFRAQIPAERNLGELSDGQPVVSRVGLASILGRMSQNFNVLKGQLGLNNDRPEKSRFSLRTEAFRILPNSATNTTLDDVWRKHLRDAIVTNLWEVPEFRRYCRPFAPESAGAQPGIVLRFGTTITAGRNFFDQELGPLDSSYDPSEFATRIRSLAVWFTGYDGANLASKPRAYLVPVGTDRLRASDGDDFLVRDWQVLDQRIPVPFPLGDADLDSLSGFPVFPSVDGSFTPIRRHSAFRVYQDAAFDLEQFSESTRLVGRSVWNSQWVLIIPGAYLLNEPDKGLNQFIESVEDVKLYFQTYSVSGN